MFYQKSHFQLALKEHQITFPFTNDSHACLTLTQLVFGFLCIFLCVKAFEGDRPESVELRWQQHWPG